MKKKLLSLILIFLLSAYSLPSAAFAQASGTAEPPVNPNAVMQTAAAALSSSAMFPQYTCICSQPEARAKKV